MERKLRIALARKDYLPLRGGAENYFAMLTRALREMGHEVHLFVNNADPDADDARFIHRVPMSRFHSSAKNWSFAVNVEKAIRSQADRFDIVCGLSKMWYQDVYRISDPLYRHWLKVHSFGLIDSVVGFMNPRHRAILHIERKIFDPHNFRRLIAISRLDRYLVQKYYHVPEEKIRVIYNGVDHERFSPADAGDSDREALRGHYGFGPEDVVFLFAAMDWKRKGLKYAIRALGMMPGEYRGHARLLVVGKGEPEKYAPLARACGVAEQVVFEGPTLEIERFYRASDAFVFPTLYDPFANVHLEALACGLPVVTTNMAGGAEIVRDSFNGFVYGAADDEESLANRMTRLMLAEDRLRMARDAVRSVEGFTVERNARETVELYYEILEEKARDPRPGYYRRG